MAALMGILALFGFVFIFFVPFTPPATPHQAMRCELARWICAAIWGGTMWFICNWVTNMVHAFLKDMGLG